MRLFVNLNMETETMNPHFLIERERTAKAFKAAAREGNPEIIAMIGKHLAHCEHNIHISGMVDVLARAAECRCLALDENDEGEADRYRRESALAEREAGVLWRSSPTADAMLSDAAIQEATPEQLGAHAWLVYAGEEVSAAQ